MPDDAVQLWISPHCPTTGNACLKSQNVNNLTFNRLTLIMDVKCTTIKLPANLFYTVEPGVKGFGRRGLL